MIKSVRLQQFRSYADSSFSFSPGVNVIVGPNASGKTNLLESILYAARGGSYRVRDADLVAFGSTWARLDLTLDEGQRIVKLQPDSTTGVIRKEFIIDHTVVKRMTLARHIPAVLFEPNHLLLLSGSPERRREYLDDLLEASQHGFGSLRRQYKRVLAQRNALLKNQALSLDNLFIWNIRLSELGGQIAVARQDLLGQINEVLAGTYSALAASTTRLVLEYHSSCHGEHYGSQLFHKLEAGSQLDRLRGFTAYGPHRDDFNVLMNGHLVQDSASRGETRSVVLALKIFELGLLQEVFDKPPILLLDDVFSELDSARRQALTDVLRQHQTFITTTDAEVAGGVEACRIELE